MIESLQGGCFVSLCRGKGIACEDDTLQVNMSG